MLLGLTLMHSIVWWMPCSTRCALVIVHFWSPTVTTVMWGNHTIWKRFLCSLHIGIKLLHGPAFRSGSYNSYKYSHFAGFMPCHITHRRALIQGLLRLDPWTSALCLPVGKASKGRVCAESLSYPLVALTLWQARNTFHLHRSVKSAWND